MARRKKSVPVETDDGEFLWLISLSDLMILLFIFFVVLYSFAPKDVNHSDYIRVLAALGNDQIKDPIEAVKSSVGDWVAEKGLDEEIEVKRDNGDLVIEIKDKVLFQSGAYNLNRGAQGLLQSLTRALGTIPKPYKLGIEGHTDDIPIRTRYIKDNWDLSAKRALSVMEAMKLPRYLELRSVVMGYADTRPVVPNRDPQGRPIPSNQIKNRRVTLRVF